jgi:hypothetical protein
MLFKHDAHIDLAKSLDSAKLRTMHCTYSPVGPVLNNVTLYGLYEVIQISCL